MDPWTALTVVALVVGVVYIIGTIAALIFVRKIWKDFF